MSQHHITIDQIRKVRAVLQRADAQRYRDTRWPRRHAAVVARRARKFFSRHSFFVATGYWRRAL